MKIDDLETLIDVADAGSFAAVAKKRNIDPSVVSRAISGLETELDVRLFQRTTRKMTLTSTGSEFVERMRNVVSEMHAATHDAKETAKTISGIVRISASSSFAQTILLPSLPDLLTSKPNLRVEVISADDITDLFSANIDLAIRMGPSVNGDLICIKLITTEYGVFASPGWVAGNPDVKSPAEIAKAIGANYALPAFQKSWLFKARDGRVTESPLGAARVISSSAMAVRQAMLMGIGPALVAKHLVEHNVKAGNCVNLFPEYTVTATTFDTAIWLVYPSKRLLPARTRAVIEWLKKITLDKHCHATHHPD